MRPAAADVRSCVRALCFPVYALNRRGAESVAGALRAWAYLLAAFCDDCLRSSWNHVEQAPADPILGVAAAFKADPVHLHPISSRPFRHARTLFSPSCAMHPHPLDFRPLLSQPPPPPPPPPPLAHTLQPPIPLAPHACFSLTARSDTQAEKKVNLGIGAYRDEAGKPWVLECVKAAEKLLLDELNTGKSNKEYLPVTGLQAFLDVTSQVILGKDSPLIKDKKVAICQSLSGTGALRISAEFLAQYNPGVQVYVSDPTWGNHHAIFAKAGLKTFKYRYLNKTMGLDLDGVCVCVCVYVAQTFVCRRTSHSW